MPEEYKPTTPKPFVFVLMPFEERFDDIYKFGIKGAADDAGAYAERVDEQMFDEGILERVFNQISKADVLVADMTGRNPNVFYEVGYAHALGKIVLLLTQDSADIPFDLKHRPHVVYGGSIDALRATLSGRLKWAVEESRKRDTVRQEERFVVFAHDEEVPEARLSANPPQVVLERPPVKMGSWWFDMSVTIRNDSPVESSPVEHIYLLSGAVDEIVPLHPGGNLMLPMVPCPSDRSVGFRNEYRLPNRIPSLPPGAAEQIVVRLHPHGDTSMATLQLRLRLRTLSQTHDYPFAVMFVQRG